jgi:hypothetical protein
MEGERDTSEREATRCKTSVRPVISIERLDPVPLSVAFNIGIDLP